MENVEFKIKDEVWNKYKLEDDSLLSVKLVLVKIGKDEGGYSFNHIPIFGVIAPPEKKGEPSPPNKAKIIKYDVKYKIIKEDWNRYLLSDNMELLAKVNIVQVNKTDAYDGHGDPVYNIQWAPIFKLKPMEKKQ